ncbi:MAG: hypothetical protein U9R36_00195, partial [Elusimicrobiota bacterium]|nr:hypothetical protein [Elusimicrobiota bacterium]
TRVGSFKIEESAAIDSWEEGFMDMESCAAKFSHVLIKKRSAEKVKNGIPFKESDIVKKSGDISSGVFAVFSEEKKLKAIASKKEESYSLERVFNL